LGEAYVNATLTIQDFSNLPAVNNRYMGQVGAGQFGTWGVRSESGVHVASRGPRYEYCDCAL